MKLNQGVFIISFLLTCHSILSGQVRHIGLLEFKKVNQSNKPAETWFGQWDVFEDNIKNQGRKISLYIEVVPARQSDQKSSPMFILMGGPGQASSDLVPFFHQILAPINERSDLVFIDQRGTGKSNPLQIKKNYEQLQDYFVDVWLDQEVLAENFYSFSLTSDYITIPL